jgi:putative lipoic acid-binding regulatory protein
MTPDARCPKLDLPYPCRWIYKVIGGDEEIVRSAVSEVLQAREHVVSLSRRSAHRTYCCLNVEVLVSDERDRITLYETLRRHPAVRLVL